MNAEQLNAIKERAAKATPGPWHRMFKVGIEIHAENEWAPVISEEEGVVRYTDADFIIHAREDVPALVVEVERYRDMWYHGLGKADAEIQANLLVIEAQQQEIERLHKALEFYAKPGNYEPWRESDEDRTDAFNFVDLDGGNTAREALAIGEESKAL